MGRKLHQHMRYILGKLEDDMTLIAVTNPLPAGTHSVGVECNQLAFGAIIFPSARLTAVARSAS